MKKDKYSDDAVLAVIILNLLVLLLFCAIIISSPDAGLVLTQTGNGNGAVFCTDTSDADITCEDFEGSTACGDGVHSVCRNTYTVTTNGANNTVDFDASPSGSMPCTDVGSNVMVIDVDTTGAGNHAYVYYNRGSTGTFYVEFWIYITDEGLGNGNEEVIVVLTTGINPDSNQSVTIKLKQKADTTLRFLGGRYTGAMTDDEGGTVITTAAWYGIRFKFINNTADTGWQWWVNYADATWTDEGAGTTGDRAPQYLHFQTKDAQYTMNLEFANIKMDDDTMPGDCAR